MFNDYVANEAAKQHIEQRVQEADAFWLHKRIGASGSMFWPVALALVALIGLALMVVLA